MSWDVDGQGRALHDIGKTWAYVETVAATGSEHGEVELRERRVVAGRFLAAERSCRRAREVSAVLAVSPV
jgi:hypothetical protein